MKPCNKFLFWMQWKKPWFWWGHIENTITYFFKNFPHKEHLFFFDNHNCFKEMEPSSRRLLSLVGKILELVLVLPEANATLEQKISKMKLIKTPICSMMSHECLNHCMIFSTHKKSWWVKLWKISYKVCKTLKLFCSAWVK